MAGDILEREHLECSVCRVQKGCGSMLEEAWPDHAIRSSIPVTKLPLGHDILTKKKNNNNNNKKEKCKKFSLDIVH